MNLVDVKCCLTRINFTRASFFKRIYWYKTYLYLTICQEPRDPGLQEQHQPEIEPSAQLPAHLQGRKWPHHVFVQWNLRSGLCWPAEGLPEGPPSLPPGGRHGNCPGRWWRKFLEDFKILTPISQKFLACSAPFASAALSRGSTISRPELEIAPFVLSFRVQNAQKFTGISNMKIMYSKMLSMCPDLMYLWQPCSKAES